MPQTNIFSGFTNLYSLTKTLRFELRPYKDSKTEEFLPNLIPFDEERAENYKKMKVILNDLHNKFIQESLELVDLDFDSLNLLNKVYLELKQKNKNRRENESEIKILEDKFTKIKEKLRKDLVLSYDRCGENWKERYQIGLKDSGYKILTEAKILDILKIIYKDDSEKLEILNSFNNFWTYFGGFNQNRENYYSAESKATSIANRCIDENLIRFFDNTESYLKISKEIVGLQKFQEKFELNSFQKFLNQDGIDEFNEKVVAEINTTVNAHNQQYKTKLPKLSLLYKQIGSDKKGFEMFEIEAGKEWAELENLILNQNAKLTDKELDRANIDDIKSLYEQFFANIDIFPLEQIYFHKASINTISNLWFKSWETLGSLLKEAKIGNVKYTGGEYKIPKLISLDQLKELLFDYKHLEINVSGETESKLFRGGKEAKYKEFYDESAWITILKIWEHEINDKFIQIETVIKKFEIEKKAAFDKNAHTSLVKEICDAYLGISQMIKYHLIKEAVEKKNEFNDQIENFIDESELDKYYNAFRNYLSKKPYSTEKFKLNFENSTLLGGWDLNKETANKTIIIKNGDQYELIILDNKKGTQCFENKKGDNSLFKDDGLGLQKMIYKLLPGPNKMLPKVAFSKKNIDFFKPDSEVLRIYEQGTFKKENFIKEDLAKMIDFWKHVLSTHPEWKEFEMKFKDSVNYHGIDEFYSEVAKQGYKIKFVPINKAKLEELENDGKIYRFKIHNKDWQEYRKGKKNLETIYWENLFSSDNLNGEPCLKLNGEGEIFRRAKTKNLIKTQKQDLAGKLVIKGKNEDKKVYENERYTEDKLFFHIPVTLNFSHQNLNGVTKFNEKVYETILENSDDVHIIGIDRGEKHLLYYSVINSKGEIVEQDTLNIIKVADKDVNFHKLLTDKQDKRNEARLNWSEIGNIKELKAGYLSHVVHKLYQLVLKYNAIIVLEDLNTGFKGKQTAKVEKAVYQKFELALAKKLNYLVLKNDVNDEKLGILPRDQGGVLKAYQLTPMIGAGDVSIFERSKQWGNIFYVSPDYTSALDPLTGWRKHIYAKNSETVENIQKLFNPDNDKGVKINYSTEHKCFVFSYVEESLNKEWKLYAYEGLERHRWNSKTRTPDSYNLHVEFDKLFATYEDRTIYLNQQILDDKANFKWKSLIFYWNILNEIRNTDKDGNDVIQSPVWSDKINGFFDTRKVEIIAENGKFSKYPINGDANGAYNIARKGRILVNRILKLDMNEKNPRPDLFISKGDWDAFVTNSKPTIKSLLF